MTSDELNTLTRRIWRLISQRGTNNVDAMEIVTRLQVSIALASCGGDPKQAVAILEATTANLVEDIRSGRVRVTQIIHSKGGTDEKAEKAGTSQAETTASILNEHGK